MQQSFSELFKIPSNDDGVILNFLGGVNSLKWLNHLVPHVGSRFHFIDKISVNFKSLHKPFLGFYKLPKTMLGGT